MPKVSATTPSSWARWAGAAVACTTIRHITATAGSRSARPLRTSATSWTPVKYGTTDPPSSSAVRSVRSSPLPRASRNTSTIPPIHCS
ncbi:hypothetical protein DEJ23_05290 [Curtobacterium sp. MCSS17_008]|nr:hypothetical protein DEJ23_05290 [Curtobacterium sp. MCSS17_008]